MRSAPLTLILMLATGTALAQPDERSARAHFLAGSSYYDQARYEDALREFEEAYRVAPPEQQGMMVYNLGQAQERLGRIDQAITSFTRYLALEPDADDRPSVEQRVRNLQARLGETGIALTVSEAGARALVDGREVGNTPLPGPIPVSPGTHDLRVEKPGYEPFVLRVSVVAGGRAEVDARLVRSAPELAVTRTEPGRPPPRHTHLLSWVLVGVAGVAIAGGTALGVLALGNSDDANDQTEGDRDLYREAESSAKRLALFADICFGAAVISAATSMVLLLLDGPSAPEESPAPRVRLDLGGTMLRGEF